MIQEKFFVRVSISRLCRNDPSELRRYSWDWSRRSPEQRKRQAGYGNFKRSDEPTPRFVFRGEIIFAQLLELTEETFHSRWSYYYYALARARSSMLGSPAPIGSDDSELCRLEAMIAGGVAHA